jgi:hypothetical protein
MPHLPSKIAAEPDRRTVNITQSLWNSVDAEREHENPEEPPNISKMVRILLREAIAARQVRRQAKKP